MYVLIILLYVFVLSMYCRVNVEDENEDSPEFDRTSYTVLENASPGQSVLRVCTALLVHLNYLVSSVLHAYRLMQLKVMLLLLSIAL